MSLFTIASTIFDIYCYALAAPGSTHYGYYIISYEFVYVGNKHGKNQSINTHNIRIIVYLIDIAYSPQHVDCLCPLLTHHGAYQLRDKCPALRSSAQGKLDVLASI